MALSNEMRKLTHGLLKASDARITTVTDIRAATSQQLAEFRGARQTMAHEQRQGLSEYVHGLCHNVDELCLNAEAFLKNSSDAHQAMAQEQRQELNEYVDGLYREVNELPRQAE